MREYVEFVLETGTDPLGEFRPPQVPTRPERWLLGFVQEKGRPKFAIARNLLREPPSPGPVRDLNLVPDFVREYAMVDDQGYMDMSWDEFVALDEVERSGDYQVFTYTEDVPAPEEGAAEAHYRQLAQRWLNDYTEPTETDYQTANWT